MTDEGPGPGTEGGGGARAEHRSHLPTPLLLRGALGHHGGSPPGRLVPCDPEGGRKVAPQGAAGSACGSRGPWGWGDLALWGPLCSGMGSPRVHTRGPHLTWMPGTAWASCSVTQGCGPHTWAFTSSSCSPCKRNGGGTSSVNCGTDRGPQCWQECGLDSVRLPSPEAGTLL